MLNAMSQGRSGSMCTIHAESSAGVFRRIASYAVQAPERLPLEATNLLIAGALHFVVHLDSDMHDGPAMDRRRWRCPPEPDGRRGSAGWRGRLGVPGRGPTEPFRGVGARGGRRRGRPGDLQRGLPAGPGPAGRAVGAAPTGDPRRVGGVRLRPVGARATGGVSDDRPWAPAGWPRSSGLACGLGLVGLLLVADRMAAASTDARSTRAARVRRPGPTSRPSTVDPVDARAARQRSGWSAVVVTGWPVAGVDRRRGRLRAAPTAPPDVGRRLDRQGRGHRHLDRDAPGDPGGVGRTRSGDHRHRRSEPRADPIGHRAAGGPAAGRCRIHVTPCSSSPSRSGTRAPTGWCARSCWRRHRGPSVSATCLQALAESTREEVSLRLRVETSRASVRSGVRTVVVFSVAFAAGLAVFARSYLAPFGSATGQLVLLAVGAPLRRGPHTRWSPSPAPGSGPAAR